MDHRSLDVVPSLDELEALVTSEPWEAYLVALPGQSDALDAIDSLRDAVARARTRLSPEHASPELQRLKAEVYDNPTADPAALRPLLARIAVVRAELPTRRHERLFGRLETAIGQRFAWTSGGIGRSNRARRARNLFTEHAGQTHIAGAATDRYGNAAGTGYDLGRDDAFEGHTIHVLQLAAFGFGPPQAAFRTKGFEVDRRTAPGPVDDFRAWLDAASQLWLISSASASLQEGHIEAIRAFWARGGALYVWGDNDPWYVDANAVLAALFGSDFEMKGNVPGGQVVHELADGRGFLPHLATTGLVHLFEGITVASLDEAVAARHGFAPLLYGSAGNLITVVRDATPEGGPILVDTAFTRLYCNWDDAGSARYVCNAGCLLAAEAASGPEEPEEGEPEDADALPFAPEGAFAGRCDLTGEPATPWAVLSVGALADELANTGDLVLTDPLSAGARNCIFTDALYSEAMGQWILGQPPERRLDPLTRQPVVACLPLVDLSHPGNLRRFTEILCVCLMGGKYLPTAARLLFFAVVDQMLDREDLRHPDAWSWLSRQCLANFPATAEFGETGPRMPLLDAMTALFSPATDPRVQIRRSLASTAVIGRTLLREGRATREAVRQIARRALVAVVVGDALEAEKRAPGTVPTELDQMLYDHFHGLPKLGGGRLVEARPTFVRDRWATEKRLEDALGGTPLLSSEEYTVVLHSLQGRDLRQFSVEKLVALLCAEVPAFRAVYDGLNTLRGSAPDPRRGGAPVPPGPAADAAAPRRDSASSPGAGLPRVVGALEAAGRGSPRLCEANTLRGSAPEPRRGGAPVPPGPAADAAAPRRDSASSPGAGLPRVVEALEAVGSSSSRLGEARPPDVLGLLNRRFAAYAGAIRPDDPHQTETTPFATTWGPSVYRCVCGERFGDPAQPLTPEVLEALRASRVAHLREAYRVDAPGETWYPGEGTLHCNLHRAVQTVIRDQFHDATEVEDAMIPAIAAYLGRDGKGFLCDPLLPGAIAFALDSYLALRRAGQPHPEGLLTLEAKARREQELPPSTR